jgi:hypothetical protein
MEPALYLPIGARCRWRKDFDGEEQRADVGPLSGPSPVWSYGYDEKIGWTSMSSWNEMSAGDITTSPQLWPCK